MSTRKIEFDVGALLLRLSIGGLMLFHGADKLIHGFGWLGPVLADKGLPAFLQYGVLLGEVVAPLLLIFGVFQRTAAGLITVTMLVAVYTVHAESVFALGEHGEYALELHVLYATGAIVAALIGAGRFAIPLHSRYAKF